MSILKKEFKKKDVQRLRNLITGKPNNKSTQGIGYAKSKSFHKEGDVWEEDGRNWTIKDGIKQNITKLDLAKEIHIMPILCPVCSHQMKKRFDKDYYKIHGKCFDCVIDFEHTLRKLGKWEDYEKRIHNGEIDMLAKDFQSWFEEMINESNNSFITEKGAIEKWDGGVDKKRALKSMKETIDYLNSLKK